MGEFAFWVALVGVIGGAITIWVFVRPSAKRSKAVADAILGEEEVRDRAGKLIAPPRPGLVARVSTVEETLALLVSTNDRLDDHEARLKILEIAAMERIVIKAESAALLTAVSNEKESEK